MVKDVHLHKMSSNKQIENIIQELVMKKENNYKIFVERGSKNGDSYSGILYKVTITSLKEDSESGKSSSLIIKIPPTSDSRREAFNITASFMREHHVYKEILPQFKNFQKSKNVKNIFNSYPEVYASRIDYKSEALILQDMAVSGFIMCPRTRPLDYQHCELVMKKLAEFHSISFALRDQQPELFKKLSNLKDNVFNSPIHPQLSEFLRKNCQYVVDYTLDAEKDQEVIEKVLDYKNKVESIILRSVDGAQMDKAVISHGDCWISNLMFKYQDGKPSDMCFLDWQITRCASPVNDISQFIMCCTDSILRERLPDLLTVYYQTLSRFILQMGSDPDKCFSKEDFNSHCKQYFVFGFNMAFMTMHATTCSDLPDVGDILDNHSFESVDEMALPLLKQKPYKDRMSGVARDMFNFGYL